MATLAAGAAFLTSLALGRASIAFGPRFGLVDSPDDHLKPHQGRPVPLGGLGVLLGLHLGLFVAGVFDWGLTTSTVLLWVVGVLDDRTGVAPLWRLGAAALAGVLIGVSREPFPGLLGLLAAIALVVVVVNAINLFDGLDGLAGAVATVSAVALAVLAGVRGYDVGPPMILAAAIVGFLVWNFPPARLFLGDNGAYVVGVTLVWTALDVSSDATSGLVAAALIGLPLLDLLATILRRARRGAALFEGDREHSYDLLHGAGMSVIRVTLTFAVAQAVWAGLVVGVSRFLGDVEAAVVASILGAAIVGWWTWASPRWAQSPDKAGK